MPSSLLRWSSRCCVIAETLKVCRALLCATACWLAMLAPPGMAADPDFAERPVVSLSTRPGGAGADDLPDLLSQLGADGAVLTARWDELEPGPRQYRLEGLARQVARLGGEQGCVLLLTVEVVQGGRRGIPADLEPLGWKDQQLKTRFYRLVDALLPLFTERVRYVSLAWDADRYLLDHPDEAAAFREFYEDAAAYLRRRAPWVAVGLTCRFDGLTGPLAKRLAWMNRFSDVVMVAYLPVGEQYSAPGPDVFRDDFPRMLDAAAGKPVLLQAVGYPSEELLGSSEPEQAAFLANVLDVCGAARDRVPMLVFATALDADLRTAERLARAMPGPPRRAALYLSSLGLRREDGTPKAAWHALEGWRSVRSPDPGNRPMVSPQE